MDLSSLLEAAKAQLDKIKAQLSGGSLSQTLKNELLINQDALQRAYDSLLKQAGVYDDGTKQQLTDALSSATKSSLAATAAANKRTMVWVGGMVMGLIVLSIVLHKIYNKHRT